LDKHRIDDTLSRLPDDLRRSWEPLVNSLTDEMKEDYLLSVKKAIGNSIRKYFEKQKMLFHL